VVTPAELAAYLRVDVRTIRKAIEAGSVPGAERVGRSWRIVMPVYDAAKARAVA
jgi:excisionase family DNA binding protein